MADFMEIIKKNADGEGNIPLAAIETLEKAISKHVGDCFVDKARYRAKLTEIAELTGKLETAESSVTTAGDWKDKHDTLCAAFDAYRQQTEQEKERTQKTALVRAALETAAADPDAIELLLNGVNLDTVTLEGGRLRNEAGLMASLKGKYGKYFGEPFSEGIPFAEPLRGGHQGITREAFAKLPLDEQMAYPMTHPEEYRKLFP